MKYLKLISKTILEIIIYSFIYSILSALKINFLTFEISLSDFSLTSMFSLFFLLSVYLLFSYYFIIILLLNYLIEKFYSKKAKNYLIVNISLLSLFYIFTLIYDSNFNDSSASLNQYLYSNISITIVFWMLYLVNNRFLKRL